MNIQIGHLIEAKLTRTTRRRGRFNWSSSIAIVFDIQRTINENPQVNRIVLYVPGTESPLQEIYLPTLSYEHPNIKDCVTFIQ